MYYIRYDLFIILNLNWIIDWNLSLSHDVNVGINVTLLRTTNNICQSKHLKNILAAATNQLISIDVYLLLILLNRLLNFFDKFETAIFCAPRRTQAPQIIQMFIKRVIIMNSCFTNSRAKNQKAKPLVRKRRKKELKLCYCEDLERERERPTQLGKECVYV